MSGDRSARVQEIRRRGAAWTAEEIHEAVKEHEPRFVVLPPGFPPEVARKLFVTDPDILLWFRFPAVAYGAPSPDAFLVADRPCTARTAGQWQRIVGCLHELGDDRTARAIQGVLAGASARQPDEPVLVALETPEDWRERVARAEARLAAIAG